MQKGVSMKRLWFYMSALVLLSSMAVASSRPDWGGDRDKHKHHYDAPEPGVISMLALSVSAIAGGLALRHRRSD